MSLHWSTDPLLLDKEPRNYNDWETANSLIEQGKIAAITSSDLNFKNIYGIMVRKIDFVRKNSRDRIIARFPFIILTDELRTKIQERTLLIAEVARDYFYRSINKSITAWRDVICKYLERGSMPFPLFRCAQELIPELLLPENAGGTIPFMSIRGEKFTFPTKLTNRLAYLCGICNGDGNLREYWIIVADETKEHIQFVADMLNDLFSKNGKLMKTGGAWIVKLNLLWAVRLFNFLTDQAIDEPKYDSLRESLLFQQLGEPFRSLYWRGVFDADGSFKRRMSFSTMSNNYAKDFQNFLSDVGIASKVVQTKLQASQVEIPAKYKWQFAEQIGTVHPKKMRDFLDFLSKASFSKSYIGINEQNLTKYNLFFDFSLLPSLQVTGLDQFLESIPFPNNVTDKYRKYTDKGVTIKKLIEYIGYLPSPNNSVMNLLQKHQETIRFQSSNSTSIKLPLQPLPTIQNLMSNLVPTARGATLLDTSEEFQKLITETFSITIVRNHLIEHRLISTFLSLFGIYKESQNAFTDSDVINLQANWFKKLEKKMNRD